jgi:hypothetical protein
MIRLFALAAQVNVTVLRYDNATTAGNTRETVLNASNVRSGGVGKLLSYYVDGSVYAQPLYLSDVPVAGHGVLMCCTSPA